MLLTNGAVVAPWDGSDLDCSKLSEMLVSVTGIANGPYTLKGAVTGANPKAIAGVNLSDLSTVLTISVDGLYSFPCAPHMTLTPTPSGGTVVNVEARC